MPPSTYCVTIWTRSPQQGDPGLQNITRNGQHQCFRCIAVKLLWRRLSAAAYGCALLLLVTFALDELAVSQATEHQNAYQATELVRNRVTPLGGRHQRRLVVYTQNHSGVKCTPLPGRYGQIDYH